MAVLAAGLVFAGFARTFYLRSHATPPLPPLLLAHGLVFTSWFVLLVVQTTLVAAGRTDVHQRLGIAGAALAALMVPVGIVTAIYATRRAYPAGGAAELAFMTTPMVDILLFATFVAAALHFRRRSETHKRLMLVATIAIFPPAIARLPLAVIAEGGPWEVFGVADAILVACVAYDTVVRRRLHPAFAWGGLLILASQPLRLALGDSDAWQRFAVWLIR